MATVNRSNLEMASQQPPLSVRGSNKMYETQKMTGQQSTESRASCLQRPVDAIGGFGGGSALTQNPQPGDDNADRAHGVRRGVFGSFPPLSPPTPETIHVKDDRAKENADIFNAICQSRLNFESSAGSAMEIELKGKLMGVKSSGESLGRTEAQIQVEKASVHVSSVNDGPFQPTLGAANKGTSVSLTQHSPKQSKTSKVPPVEPGSTNYDRRFAAAGAATRNEPVFLPAVTQIRREPSRTRVANFSTVQAMRASEQRYLSLERSNSKEQSFAVFIEKAIGSTKRSTKSKPSRVGAIKHHLRTTCFDSLSKSMSKDDLDQVSKRIDGCKVDERPINEVDESQIFQQATQTSSDYLRRKKTTFVQSNRDRGLQFNKTATLAISPKQASARGKKQTLTTINLNGQPRSTLNKLSYFLDGLSNFKSTGQQTCTKSPKGDSVPFKAANGLPTELNTLSETSSPRAAVRQFREFLD